MGWVYLYLGLIVSLIGHPLLKIGDGFAKPFHAVAGMVLMTVSLAFWVLALKTLPMSVAYIVWSGTGILLLAMIDIFYFHEPVSALRIVLMLMVLAGCIGLNLTGGKG